MKNTKVRKIFKIALVVLAVLLCLMFADLARVVNGSKPLFCLPYITADDGGSGQYIGLGYGFDIDGRFMPEDYKGVTSFDFYIFGIKLL